jgi:hypothetical protein
MSNPVKLYRKSVVERRRLYLDYSCWLEENESLVSFQATTVPFTEGTPLSVSAAYTDVDQKKLAMFIGGGKANTDYTIQMVVTTNVGQVKRDDIGMRVAP